MKTLCLWLPLLFAAGCGEDHDYGPGGVLERTTAEFLKEDARFRTFVGLVEKAGAMDRLGAEIGTTVFAPTEEAFGKFGDGLTILTKAGAEEALKTFVLYHMAEGKLKLADLQTGELATLAGKPLQVEMEGGHDHAHINDEHPEVTDIFTSNGVVHVFDSVFQVPAK